MFVLKVLPRNVSCLIAVRPPTKNPMKKGKKKTKNKNSWREWSFFNNVGDKHY